MLLDFILCSHSGLRIRDFEQGRKCFKLAYYMYLDADKAIRQVL